MKTEHRKGEMPDSIYLLIENVVEDIFCEYETTIDFDIKYFPRKQMYINRTFNNLMKEGFVSRMRDKIGIKN